MSDLQSSPPFDSSPSPALLIQAVQAISTAGSLAAIIRIANATARTGTGADGVSFVLREGEECHYIDEDSIRPLWKGRRFPINTCVSGWAMLHRQAAVIPDIMLDARVPQDTYEPTFVRSLVMVPIRSQAPLGAIGAYWVSIRSFNPALVTWLQALADAASAGIEAVRANEEVAELRRSNSRPPHGEPTPELVRMCAWTKRLYHAGQWVSVEAFLRSRYGLQITHGMSDEARLRLEAEMLILLGDPPTKPGP